jgi:hypothetical protein
MCILPNEIGHPTPKANFHPNEGLNDSLKDSFVTPVVVEPLTQYGYTGMQNLNHINIKIWDTHLWLNRSVD